MTEADAPRLLVDGAATHPPLAGDRGLAYGDGVFETIAWRAGAPLAWDAHLARLVRGCEVLRLPAVDAATLRAEAARVAAGLERAVVKIVITRGDGGRGYRPPASPSPRRLVAAHDWPAHADDAPDAGARVWICAHPLSVNRRTAGLKHLNRLDQVLASAEWPSEAHFEGLMLDPEGHLVEGTRSNLFVVRDGALRTPYLGRCGVAGVVRAAVLDACRRLDVPVAEDVLDVDELRAADEVFLTNSVIGVRSVTTIDAFGGITLAPGPVAARLRAALAADGIVP